MTSVHPKSEPLRFGLDIGGTHLAAGLVDGQYNLVAKAECAFDFAQGDAAFQQAVASLLQKLAENPAIKEVTIKSAGVAVSGEVDNETGRVVFTPNLHRKNWPLVALLQQVLPPGIPVMLVNDADAAALGEAVAGAAKGAKSSVTFTIGTGVGAGFVQNGKLYQSPFGAAIEVGHMVIHKGGERCNCGRSGCFERYASTAALHRQAKAAAAQNPQSLLAQKLARAPESGRPSLVFEAAAGGDPTAQEVLNAFFDALACGMANVINLLQPQVVCVGGAISRQGEALIAPLRQRLATECFSKGYNWNTALRTAALGNAAGVVGAAAMGEEKIG